MNRKLLTTAALAVTALALSACASAKPATGIISGPETLSASLSGKAAAADLNSNVNLVFPKGTLSGVLGATITPMALGGGNGCTGSISWVTTQGGLAVTHTAQGYCGNSNTPPPATWTENAKTKTCHFIATFSKGTFAEISGVLTNTTWKGTYIVTAEGYVPLKGKTCSFQTTGNVENSGASIVFTATGTMIR